MYILGISCWYHDGAAALIKDGRIVACAEEERFTRIKHDFEFPINAITFALARAGITSQDIDYVVFYDKPLVKFDRILSSIISHVPHSGGVFREAVPVWLKEKLNFRKKVRKTLHLPESKVLFCRHHLSHAASAFYPSPFEKAALLTVDGVGELATASVGQADGNSIKILEEMHFPDSVGLLYSAFTAFLGFEVNEGEYKVMGMAPYGEPLYIDKVKRLLKIAGDGSIDLDLRYFSFPYSTKKTYTRQFEEIFGPARVAESKFFTRVSGYPDYYGVLPADYNEQCERNKYYADIAASIQAVTEEILVTMAQYARRRTGMKDLAYAGGVALNSKANYRIMKEGGFENIFIQPAATDAGGALGAALWCWHQVLGKGGRVPMEHSYWGADFTADDVRAAAQDKGLPLVEMHDDELSRSTAEALAGGKVVGWCQGRTEWGPRALGNRSILADPRKAAMKEIVNVKIKFREPFRPFAPSTLREDLGDYFELERELPPHRFMLMTHPVRQEKRDVIPAVTHIDGSSRLQSVVREQNPRYWELIKAFKDITGVGVVLNTSFNLRGEPIVNTPADAINTFLNSGIDILVLGNFVIKKKQ
jgi:carbamoyltransferase